MNFISKEKLNQPTVRLTFSAIMIAASVILGMIVLFRMPQGGSVTPLSMLPLLIVGYIYGPVWGFTAGAVGGVINMLLGGGIFGSTLWVAVGSVFLDYVLAFGALGLSGIFKKLTKNAPLNFILGIIFACALRYILHVISGVLLFSSYAPAGQLPLIYSMVYNLFMMPEAVLCCIGGAVVAKAFRFEQI